MTIKILLTGASGYVGGAALDAVYTAHPDYEYSLLVRDEERAKPIKAKYPDAKFLYGTLEDSDLVRDAALDTDIVIRMYLIKSVTDTIADFDRYWRVSR
ncbi:hypothetical protein Golomagni_07587 [Golovinomyces magnicellulatus]|nr:hypothetical protein Golomagni_07587 [Golovinomyces magnicellulatus]